MSTTATFADYSLIAKKIYPQAELLRHWPLAGGVSAQIEALEIALSGKDTVKIVLRSHKNHDWKAQQSNVTASEFELLDTLFKAGFALPKPVLLDSSCSILADPYFLMEWVEGTTTVAASEGVHAIKQMSEFLANLHSSNIELVAKIDLPRNDDPIAGALNYIPNNKQYASIRKIVAAWQLAPHVDVLLHGDYWPGNVIWHNAHLSAVIDWEDASIGSPLSDLAGCRSELMVAYGETLMQQFSTAYMAHLQQIDGPTISMRDLPIWELYGGHAALATMAEWGLPKEVEIHRREQTQLFVERAARALQENQIT